MALTLQKLRQARRKYDDGPISPYRQTRLFGGIGVGAGFGIGCGVGLGLGAGGKQLCPLPGFGGGLTCGIGLGAGFGLFFVGYGLAIHSFRDMLGLDQLEGEKMGQRLDQMKRDGRFPPAPWEVPEGVMDDGGDELVRWLRRKMEEEQVERDRKWRMRRDEKNRQERDMLERTKM